MPTVAVTVSKYNELRLRTALAAAVQNGNAQNGGGAGGTSVRVSVPVSTLARDAAMLELEEGPPMAGSSTTQAAPPQDAVRLCPARDPVNAGRTVRVEWAGRCHGCQAPIWVARWPGTRQQAPRRCPGCGGGSVFRAWHVRQGPEGVIETRGNGNIAGWNDDPLAESPPERKNEMGLYDGPTESRARRGGRPRKHRSKAAAQAVAARAYRARRRTGGPG
jgi:hypothetical protein